MRDYSIFHVFGAETKNRLFNNLPDKPYCSNNLRNGLVIRTKKTAFEKYICIQLNKYYAICYLTFDVDREGAGAEWYFDLDLPAPTFVTINPENLYAHLVYELITPVLLWENARQKPIEWLSAIRRAWTEALRADAGYNGLISKNPNHSHWHILDFGGRYELVELSEAVTIKDHHYQTPKGFREDFAQEGRNNFLFEMGRFYSYRKKDNCKNETALQEVIFTHINNINHAEFATPLPTNEVRHIAKSIAKFTWQNRYTITGGYKRKTDDEGLKKIRSANAHQTAEIKRLATEGKIKKAIDKFLREGRRITKAGIAREAGISRQAMSTYYSHMF